MSHSGPRPQLHFTTLNYLHLNQHCTLNGPYVRGIDGLLHPNTICFSIRHHWNDIIFLFVSSSPSDLIFSYLQPNELISGYFKDVTVFSGSLAYVFSFACYFSFKQNKARQLYLHAFYTKGELNVLYNVLFVSSNWNS